MDVEKKCWSLELCPLLWHLSQDLENPPWLRLPRGSAPGWVKKAVPSGRSTPRPRERLGRSR